ncbi:MAG: tRNA (adenosine(37)-N6)-threonylcarbamoyltransferase complex transferase subunit TsaD [Paludibacteraceae bacterium]|nr:tRNA (adenosine(37)-N6)-threonylcarbamoyltransferase complex transferase subunit TsaD [Paludibacteraceae bacterium]
MTNKITILSIESSCDDTSAAVIRDGLLLSNVTASQSVHEEFGGVVPELASRAHQQNIVPVVDAALRRAGVDKRELSAIAFTRGPGLLGSLLVGTSFAKGLALSLNRVPCEHREVGCVGIPLIEVNHLQGHVMAHFVHPADSMIAANPKLQGIEFKHPAFPFLCLLVSGGNSQIVLVESGQQSAISNQHVPTMKIIGQTIDDAAGEAFDKCAKVLGLPYPGGPWVDKLAQTGDATRYPLAKPNIPGYDYSFSGLKTSFLYSLRDQMRAEGVETIDELAAKVPNLREDYCAALQTTVIDILMRKLKRAASDLGIRQVALAGGVSANSGLRAAMLDYARRYHWQAFIPPFSFTTDNAAMIAQAAYYKFLDHDFCPIDAVPYAKTTI